MLITGNEVYYGRIPDAFEAVLTPKIAAFGADYLGAVLCPDDSEFMGNAILEFMERGAELILLTGGMSVDDVDDILFSGSSHAAGKYADHGKTRRMYPRRRPGRFYAQSGHESRHLPAAPLRGIARKP